MQDVNYDDASMEPHAQIENQATATLNCVRFQVYGP
jgi:hypothetical protein